VNRGNVVATSARNESFRLKFEESRGKAWTAPYYYESRSGWMGEWFQHAWKGTWTIYSQFLHGWSGVCSKSRFQHSWIGAWSIYSQVRSAQLGRSIVKKSVSAWLEWGVLKKSISA
jgi:hypothetical protein